MVYTPESFGSGGSSDNPHALRPNPSLLESILGGVPAIAEYKPANPEDVSVQLFNERSAPIPKEERQSTVILAVEPGILLDSKTRGTDRRRYAIGVTPYEEAEEAKDVQFHYLIEDGALKTNELRKREAALVSEIAAGRLLSVTLSGHCGRLALGTVECTAIKRHIETDTETGRRTIKRSRSLTFVPFKTTIEKLVDVETQVEQRANPIKLAI